MSAEGRWEPILSEGPWDNATHSNNDICNAASKPTNILRMIDRILHQMIKSIVLQASPTDKDAQWCEPDAHRRFVSGHHPELCDYCHLGF